jgi:hypothetical protein
MPPPPARHGATAPNSPTCTKPRVEARLSCTCLARPCLSARRGRLVTRACRAATRRRSRSCTNEHGSTAKPTTLPRTATARTRRARPPAWGSRGATPPLITFHTRDRIALRAATAKLRGTTGPGAPSTAARQSCGAKASTQARSPQRCDSTHGMPSQEEIQGGEERRRLRCSRGGDGVVVAGLPVTWRRCSVREGVPAK